MRLKAATLFVFISLILPLDVFAATPVFEIGFIPERTCANASYLVTTIEYTDGPNTTSLVQRPLYCPFGCTENVGRYGADCSNPPYVIPLIFYLIILGATSTCLVAGIIQQRWLLCMMASVFFLYLAFQSFVIDINGQTFSVLPLVFLTAFAGIISLLFTLHGVIEAYRKAREEKAVDGSIESTDKTLRRK